MGILLFPLKKSMKEVVLFDRKWRGRNKFRLKIHLENGEKKALVLRMNKVTKWMLKPHSKTQQKEKKQM